MQTDKHPILKVSIIICTHNRAELLPEVIGYLVRQDYPSEAYEIIVVDHRSTDNTRGVVEEIRQKHGSLIRYVYESRFGVTMARNRGAKEAQFPYIAYIDDDCRVSAEWLANLMCGFGVNQDVVAVGGPVIAEWQRPKPEWFAREMATWIAQNRLDGFKPRLLDDDECLVEANSVFIKKNFFLAGGFLGMEQFGSRNMAASEIVCLLKTFQKQGKKIAYVPNAILHHKVFPPSPKRFVIRAFWQGVSDLMVYYYFNSITSMDEIINIGQNLITIVGALMMAAISLLGMNKSKCFFFFIKASRRGGQLVGQIRIVGDWKKIRAWRKQQELKIPSALKQEI